MNPIKAFYAILPIVAVMLFLGSSGSGSGIAPSVGQNHQTGSSDKPGLTSGAPSNPIQVSKAGEHSLIGAYRLRLYDNGKFDLIRQREAEAHVNVTKMLFPPNCLDCFKAELVDLIGDIWNFNFTIKNPSDLTGYDCRVDILDLAGISILNPTSYTDTFALPNDPDPVNPFVVFDTGNGQNKWIPQATATTPVTLERPTGTKFTDVVFVIDASYPDNQEDPYKLSEVKAEPPTIDTDQSDSTNLFVNVYDWQANVNFVTVDLSSIGGSSTAEMSKAFGNTWILENVGYTPGGGGLGPGDRNLLITASSANQKTYNYLPLKVTGATEPLSVKIEQSDVSVLVGEDINFTAVPSGGISPYYYDWDMNYDGKSFNSDISGEKVSWNWTTPGTYNIRLRGQDYGGSLAWADSQALVVVTKEVKIIVVTPNGGEVWGAGLNKDLKWLSYNFDGTVYIDYSKDDFVSDINSIASNVPNTGTYTWKDIPLDPTINAKVRITSTNYPTVSDESDAAFTITPQPYFTLTSPNGGESWLVGTSQDITWTSKYITGKVDLQYSTDDFNFDIKPIATGIDNTGSYQWVGIPDDQSNKVKVRIKMSDDSSIFDDSDNYFTITGPWICISSPNGGEEWYAGTSQDITWDSLGVSGNVKIEYSKDYFLSDDHVIAASVPNTGSYQWQDVPLDISTTVLVKVSSVSNPAVSDTSDNYFSLTGPWIKVTTPNGGEQWIVDGNGSITWTSDPNIVNVGISLSLDGGGAYPISVTDSTPNDGSYTWIGIPPAAASNTARIKIFDLADSSVNDISNSNFAIKTPWVKVSSPNGGEQWNAGSSHDITWTSGFMSGKLKIEYSKDNFVSDINLIANNVTDDGDVLWQDIPNDYSSTVKVRITSIDHSYAYDASDANFTIMKGSITVTAPNGGEKYYSGDYTNINWVSSNLTGDVEIEYSTDSFVSDINLITSDTANSGSFPWSPIPSENSSTVKVRIISLYDNAIYDDSNNNFSIKPKPSITVTSPNGGENWLVGSNQDITWTSQNVTGTLFIDYSKDNFVSDIHSITSGETNDGTYTWKIPSDVSNTVKVRVSMTDDTSIYDKSNANFSISKPYIQVTYPNGGESLGVGNSETITWNSLGVTGTVYLVYSKDNFVSDYHTIATGALNSGSYVWSPIPDDPSTTVKVRVVSTDDPSVFGSSNANFSIVETWIKVLQPNGGETLTVGSSYDIKWSSFLVTSNVNIVYSRTNFHTYSVIASDVPNNGSYAWNPIPDDPGGNLKVGVGSTTDASVFDSSDNGLTISN